MSINWAGEIFDTLISLLGKYGRWLNARGRRACFIIWSICTLYWAVRDFRLGLYSQAIFCLFSVALNAYGYVKWKRIKIDE
jgi:nicotinamide riboside transporter PnuC